MACAALFGPHASSNVRFAERQAAGDQGAGAGVPESGRVDVPALHRPENLKLVAFEPDVVGAQRGWNNATASSIVTDSFRPAVGILRDQLFDVGGHGGMRDYCRVRKNVG